MLISRYP